MKHMIAALLLVAACKGTGKDREPTTVDQIPSDAKAELYVVHEDPRFVQAGDETGRQVFFYSASKDRTYVVDEKSGKVVGTMHSRPAPAVIVVEPAPKAKAAPEPAPEMEEVEGCGGGTDGCEVAIEE